VGTDLASRGFFSVLRWRADPTRDEARNVAVVLVNEDGTAGGVRAAPISSVSGRLHEQGLLDGMVEGLQQRFDGSHKPRLSDLVAMRSQLQRSLYLSEPQPVAVSDVDLVLDALYHAYAAPRTGGSAAATKGRVLDHTLAMLRRRGWVVRRGEYVGDFIFDLVADKPERLVGEVLSFASGAANLVPVERDAGHFLYGLKRLAIDGLAVLKEPPDDASQSVIESFRRVHRWLGDEGVRIVRTDDLDEPVQARLSL
jgi:hypothetical protein